MTHISRQPFTSSPPLETLNTLFPPVIEHYGKKGMRWGVVNEDDASDKSTARRNEDKKQKMAKELTTKKDESSGLSSGQKKAILAAGVGVVSIAGFVAYKHYAGGSATKNVSDLTDWGNPFPKKVDMSGLKTQRLSKNPLGAMGKQGEYALHRADKLALNTSKGYADWLPIGGFANEHVAARHDSTIRALEAMREKYPAIRNMNIEVAPMSHATRAASMGAAGMVEQLGNGEARLYYNDVRGAVTEDMSSFIPGFRDPDHLGTHEMGHVLAGAHGALISRDVRNQLASKVGLNDHHLTDDIRQAEDRFHIQLLARHGLTFADLKKLGGYASTSPVEALAELSAYYHSPNLRSRLSPEMLKKAESLFNDMGGV